MKHSPKKSLDSVSNFIEKTYRILENDEFVSVVEWTPMGSSFIIKDIKQFQQNVLPVHFKHSNFSSFVRQLNMYNFHKVRGDRQDCEFEHEQFKKGRRDLLYRIKRKQSQALILSHNNIEQNGINIHSMSESSHEIRKTSEICQSNNLNPETKEADYQKMEELQKSNKQLKQLKNKKLEKQKSLICTNPNQMGQKFFKLIASLLAEKIRKEKGLPYQSYDKDVIGCEGNSSFDELLEHIIGNSPPLKFTNYSQTARSVSAKHNSYDFMVRQSQQ